MLHTTFSLYMLRKHNTTLVHRHHVNIVFVVVCIFLDYLQNVLVHVFQFNSLPTCSVTFLVILGF